MALTDYKKYFTDQAADYLYIFIRSEYLTSNRYFGRYTSRIAEKQQMQRNYIEGLIAANRPTLSQSQKQSDFNQVKTWVRDALANTYKPMKNPTTGKMEDASPESMLYYLSQGYNIAGKNWKQGVYGGDDRGVSEVDGLGVNPDTGAVFRLSSAASAQGLTQQMVYNAGKKEQVLVLDRMKNTAYTVAKAQNDGGKSWAFVNKTLGNGTTTNLATGETRMQNVLTVFENINAMLPQITNLITSIATSLSGVDPTKIAPSQTADGWVDKASDNSGLVTTAALAAGVLLIGKVVVDPKQKKSKR